MQVTLSLNDVREYLMTLLEKGRLSLAEVKILMAVYRAIQETGKCDLTNTRLAELTKLSRQHIIAVIDHLKEKGFLKYRRSSIRERQIFLLETALKEEAEKPEEALATQEDSHGEEE